MPEADVSFFSTRDTPGDVTGFWASRTNEYARHRPAYPDQAVRVVLDGFAPPAMVIDVGSGTGILSRLLARHGARVIAIEPGQAMRRAAAEAEQREPLGIDYRDGRAEATGLPDGFAHIVTCAQSFHWFDAPRALAEFHRILRPGGRLALLWNVREPGDAPAEWFERVVRRAQDAAEAAGRIVRRERAADPARTGHFINVRRLRFRNDAIYTLEGLLGRARSSSYWPDPGPWREELEADLIALHAAHRSGDAVTLAQVCEVTLADRADRVGMAAS